MDDGTQTKAILESGLWDAAGWVIATLAAGVAALMKRSWRQMETRQDELETRCAHDLTQHAVADAKSHDDIRRELATELRLVNIKIEANNDKAVERYDALSTQMSTQHGKLTERVDKILELMAGGKT